MTLVVVVAPDPVPALSATVDGVTVQFVVTTLVGVICTPV